MTACTMYLVLCMAVYICEREGSEQEIGKVAARGQLWRTERLTLCSQSASSRYSQRYEH